MDEQPETAVLLVLGMPLLQIVIQRLYIEAHDSIGYAGDQSYIPKLSLFPAPRTSNHTGRCRRLVSRLRYSDTSIQDRVHGAVKRGFLRPYIAGQREA